jgi:hypothetical protein
VKNSFICQFYLLFHEVSKNTRAIPQLEIKSGIKLTLVSTFPLWDQKIALSAKGHSLKITSSPLAIAVYL